MVKVIYRNFVLAGSCVSWISTTVDFDSRSLRFVHFNILKNSFFHLVAPVIPSCHRLESGCKGKACFSFSKLFKLFFQTFFPSPRLTSFPRAISLKSGCKDKAMIPPFPNFFTIIFHLFFNPPTNTVTGKTLGRKIFTGKTGKTTGKREGKAARPGKGTALSPGKHLSGTPVNVFETSLIRIWHAFNPCLPPVFNGKTTGITTWPWRFLPAERTPTSDLIPKVNRRCTVIDCCLHPVIYGYSRKVIKNIKNKREPIFFSTPPFARTWK